MFNHKTYRQFLREKFGENVLKIPVNAGFSCPNKENGNTGCIFCDNRSFSPAALNKNNVVEQFVSARDKMLHKYSLFIPYLQPNTNTYASVDELKNVYEPLISQDNVVGIAVGTRPDAIDGAKIEYLSSVNTRTYLSLELGLQSANDKTLKIINRGHNSQCFYDASMQLFDKNIEVVAHIMLGLPYESEEDMLNTAKFISGTSIKGVKIHQLMIIKDTPLEKWFNDGKISVFSLEKYAETLAKFLENLRKDIVLHRITADCSVSNGLIAPLWSAKKDSAINYIRNYLDKL